jgi:hypothetical protein
MDAYVNIRRQKISNLYGRESIYKTILDYVNKKDIICIYGNSGIGKSFLVKQVLKNLRTTELSHDILKNKNDTLDFLEKVKHTYSTIFIDDIETDCSGWKEIIEYMKTHTRINKGALVIILKNINKIDFCDCIHLQPYSLEKIKEIGKEKFINKNEIEILLGAKKCNGNLNIFLNSFQFDGKRDILLSPKDVVHNLLCPGKTNPSDFIGEYLEEHGYSWGIVHENYPRAKNITMETVQEISENMSLADIYDNKLYYGYWDLNPYFCQEAIIEPSIKLKQSLYRESMNPGSAWTKYNNMKMRMGKIKQMRYRNKYLRLDNLDVLMNLQNKCIEMELEVIPILKHYNLEYGDLDVINHLALVNKIKPKLLNNLKKELKKS